MAKRLCTNDVLEMLELEDDGEEIFLKGVMKSLVMMMNLKMTGVKVIKSTEMKTILY